MITLGIRPYLYTGYEVYNLLKLFKLNKKSIINTFYN